MTRHKRTIATVVFLLPGLLATGAGLIPGRGLAAPQAASAERPGTDPHGAPLRPGALARICTPRFRHGDSFLSAAFSPDGTKVASGCGDGTVCVWEAATGKELLALKAHHYFVSALVFAPDGKVLISRGR